MTTEEKLHQDVSEYYGKVLTKTSDLKSDACVVSNRIKDHHKEVMKKISPKVIEKYYGCGSPVPDPLDGTSVLDLGSGTGLDCFVISALSGSNGSVLGIDMTDEQLAVANEAVAFHKAQFPESAPIEFRKGYIEDLKACGIADNSFDIVISNCVINLSSDKKKVFSEIYRVLKDKEGEVHISDIFSDRELPQLAREDKMLVGECLGNALDVSKFTQIMSEVGFADLRVVEVHTVSPPENVPEQVIPKETKFYSITFSSFKGINDTSYKNDIVEYKGGIAGASDLFQLDVNNVFKVNEKVAVNANIAEILKTKRYSRFFNFSVDENKEHPTPKASLPFFDCVLSETAKQAQPPKSQCCCCCCGCGDNK